MNKVDADSIRDQLIQDNASETPPLDEWCTFFDYHRSAICSVEHARIEDVHYWLLSNNAVPDGTPYQYCTVTEIAKMAINLELLFDSNDFIKVVKAAKVRPNEKHYLIGYNSFLTNSHSAYDYAMKGVL